MPRFLVFAYDSGFTLQTTPHGLSLSVAISEYFDLTLISFFSSALVCALLGLRKKFSDVFRLVLEGRSSRFLFVFLSLMMLSNASRKFVNVHSRQLCRFSVSAVRKDL